MDASERSALVRKLQQDVYQQDEWFMQSRQLGELQRIDRDIRGGYGYGRRPVRLNRQRKLTLRSKVMLTVVGILFACLAFDAFASMGHALIVFWASGN